MCEDKIVYLFPELCSGMNVSRSNALRLAVCEHL